MSIMEIRPAQGGAVATEFAHTFGKAIARFANVDMETNGTIVVLHRL